MANQGRLLTNDNLQVVAGDVTKQSDVDAAFAAAQDEVIGTIVSLGGKTKDVGPTMLTDGTSCVISAMKANGVKRVSIVTSIGAGDSEKQAPLFFKALMYTVMRGIFTDKTTRRSSSPETWLETRLEATLSGALSVQEDSGQDPPPASSM